jgi:hypothetical protein
MLEKKNEIFLSALGEFVDVLNLERDVEFLDIDIVDDDDVKYLPRELARYLFYCNKRVILKLGGYMAPIFPKVSCFPSLKELTLKDTY